MIKPPQKVFAEITLLPSAKGPRRIRPNRYMPHIVVGPPDQQKAIIDPQKGIIENYLGVFFTDGPEIIEIGVPTVVELTLMYHPEVDYSELTPGSTFTIREGGAIVGFGHSIPGA